MPKKQPDLVAECMLFTESRLLSDLYLGFSHSPLSSIIHHPVISRWLPIQVIITSVSTWLIRSGKVSEVVPSSMTVACIHAHIQMHTAYIFVSHHELFF